MEHFFSQNSSGDLRSDAHRSQIIGGDADVDHTQILGGIQSNYCGGYIPPSSAVATGGPEGRAPPNDCMCPPILATQNTVFGTSHNDNATNNHGKKNNYIQT